MTLIVMYLSSPFKKIDMYFINLSSAELLLFTNSHLLITL